MTNRPFIWFLLVACSAATLTSWIASLWASPLSSTLLLMSGFGWLVACPNTPLTSVDRSVWFLIAIPAWGAIQILLGFTVYVNASLVAIAHWTALAVVFWMATALFADKHNRHGMLTFFGILASAIAWVALLQPHAGRLGVESLRSVAADAYAGSFSNRNMYACFAELALPVLLWLGLREGHVRWHWLLNAAALVGSVMNSGSRGGSILILVECIAFVFIATSGQKLYAKLAFGAAVAVIALAAATFGDGALATRLQYSDPFVFRRDIYQSGIAMFAERPLLGFGLGAFSAAYPAYALFDNGRFVNLAHNDWLQLAVEGGLGTLAVFASFSALLLRGFRQSPWALGIPVVLVHALVDFPFHRAGVAAWWMILAGALRATLLLPPGATSRVL